MDNEVGDPSSKTPKSTQMSLSDCVLTLMNLIRSSCPREDHHGEAACWNRSSMPNVQRILNGNPTVLGCVNEHQIGAPEDPTEPVIDVEKLPRLNEVDSHALANEQVYRSERDALIKRRDQLADLFDKGRVALATGALVGSVGIVKDLVPTMSRLFKVSLGFGWTFLSLSLVVSVYAVYKAAFQHHRQIEILDDDHRAGVGKSRIYDNRVNEHLRPLLYLNTLSLWFLSLGILMAGVALFGAFTTAPTSTIPEMSKDKPIIITPTVKPDQTKTFPSSGTPVTANPNGGSGSSGNQGNQGNQGGGGKK